MYRRIAPCYPESWLFPSSRGLDDHDWESSYDQLGRLGVSKGEHQHGGGKNGRNLLISGGVVSGVGVATALIGVIVGASNNVGGFANMASLGLYSVGGISLIIGVILLIIGGVRRARARNNVLP